MKSKKFSENLAAKAAAIPAVKKSWDIHIQAFGPFLEHAFENDEKSRIELIAALNYISRQELQKGYDKLQPLRDACVTDADKMAWLFFNGLVFDMSGNVDAMLNYYNACNEYDHTFYMPYLKIAKRAHIDGVFEIAEENYMSALSCFGMDEIEREPQKLAIYVSVLTNLVSCQTMMHHYGDAMGNLEKAKALMPRQRGRFSAEVILYAAMGDAEKAEEILKDTADEDPASVVHTRKMTADILSGKHPHFSVLPVDTALVGAFWDFFSGEEFDLRQLLYEGKHDEFFEILTEQLKPLYPFMIRDLQFGVENEGERFRVYLADFFMESLRAGYEMLLEACPPGLEEYWIFEITR